jgi:nitrilase
MTGPAPFTAAVVQASPVFLDRDATVEKACGLIAMAGARGAKLVVLPEAYVPAYPAWVWYLPLTRRPDVAKLYRALVENAIDVPGPETERLGLAARDAGAWVAIGVNERNAKASRTTLYNTGLLFDDRGALVEARRKLMPTGGERLVWTPGEPVPLRVHDTPLGRVGALICWENYMPLARFALYEQGVQIHLAPTWDYSEAWLASMRHVAREGRTWVIGCSQAVRRDEIPDHLPFKDAIPESLEWINAGNSVVVDPDGGVVAGPLARAHDTLYVEIDPGRAAGSRWIFDAAGHYHRPDLFHFAMRAPATPEAAPVVRERSGRLASAAARKPRKRPARTTRRRTR